MEISKEKFNPLRVAKIFFLLFLIFLFFPVRYVFPTASSFMTGLYSDFTSFSLYLSDIFLFIAFFFVLWYNYKYFTKYISFPHILAIIWLFLLIFIHYKSISGLNIWYLVKFLEISLVSYGTTVAITNISAKGGQISKNWFLFTFLGLGTLQSAIGLLQFIEQSSLGLNKLGEQILKPTLWGVAKVVSGGTTYLRTYGTFPHPNPLSAFLLVTILINIYLLISTTWKRGIKIWLNLALFINILGITATFSRGAYLALGVGLLLFFSIAVIARRRAADEEAISTLKKITSVFDSEGREESPRLERAALATTFIKLLFALLISFLIFKPFLLSRATITDQATIERGVYNRTALSIIKNQPLTGIGMGESVLHMEQYSPTPLNPYQIQPIHNFFLLSAAELGIPGMLILIWIFISHLKKLVSSIKYQVLGGFQNLTTYYLLLTSLLLCFFVLMFFDHYFYTLQQTQMLLWIVLGLIAAEKNPQNGDNNL